MIYLKNSLTWRNGFLSYVLQKHIVVFHRSEKCLQYTKQSLCFSVLLGSNIFSFLFNLSLVSGVEQLPRRLVSPLRKVIEPLFEQISYATLVKCYFLTWSTWHEFHNCLKRSCKYVYRYIKKKHKNCLSIKLVWSHDKRQICIFHLWTMRALRFSNIQLL